MLCLSGGVRTLDFEASVADSRHDPNVIRLIYFLEHVTGSLILLALLYPYQSQGSHNSKK